MNRVQRIIDALVAEGVVIKQTPKDELGYWKFVASENGKELGFARVTSSRNHFGTDEVPKRSLHLDWIEVGKRHRRKGVGSKLYQAIYAFMRSHGYTKLSMNSFTPSGEALAASTLNAKKRPTKGDMDEIWLRDVA